MVSDTEGRLRAFQTASKLPEDSLHLRPLTTETHHGRPDPWIGALRHSHGRLQALVEPLGLSQLEQRSYASEWSIAQVLSHLGSQAEIFGGFHPRAKWHPGGAATVSHVLVVA